MFALALAVACSVSIGMIFKYAGRQGLDRTALLTVNYAAAVGVAGLLLLIGGRSIRTGLTLSWELLSLGGGAGILLIGGFFALSWATEVAGMSLAIGVMRVSVVIPFLASWLVWEEVPTAAQAVGMVLAAGAFVLMAHRRSAPDPVSRQTSTSSSGTTDLLPVSASVDWYAAGVLALTFCLGGAVDVSMKVFQEEFGAGNSQVLFLLLAFGMAFLVGTGVVIRRGMIRGEWPTGQTGAWGLLLGIVNYGSLEFLLRAIKTLPGPFVFPANNIAIMALAAVLGVVVWGEELARPHQIGLGMAIVALVLLGL